MKRAPIGALFLFYRLLRMGNMHGRRSFGAHRVCHTVFRRCVSGSNTARDALCGLALTESLVFALLDLFHFRGIDALEIE